MPLWVPRFYFEKIWFVKVVGQKMISANKHCTTLLKFTQTTPFNFSKKLLTGIKSRTNTNIVKDKDKDINSRRWLFRSMSGASLPAPNERRQADEPKMRMLHLRRNSKGTERLRSNFVSLSASSGYNFLSSKFECNFFNTQLVWWPLWVFCRKPTFSAGRIWDIGNSINNILSPLKNILNHGN